MRYTRHALTLLAGASPSAGAAGRAAAAVAQENLAGFVTDAARRVHHRYGYLRPQRAADFVAEAPAHMTVVLLERFADFHAAVADASRSDDPAAGFLYTAVVNLYVSTARRRTPAQLTDAPPGGGGDGANPFDRMSTDNRRPGTPPEPSLDAADFWSAPLPPADRAVLDRWRPIDALVLLVLSGLHTKVDPGRWRAWLDHCGVDGPVPSPATLALPEAKRRDRLAVELKLTRNGLDQIWSRKRGRLADLQFVARLRRDHAGLAAA